MCVEGTFSISQENCLLLLDTALIPVESEDTCDLSTKVQTGLWPSPLAGDTALITSGSPSGTCRAHQTQTDVVQSPHTDGYLGVNGSSKAELGLSLGELSQRKQQDLQDD